MDAEADGELSALLRCGGGALELPVQVLGPLHGRDHGGEVAQGRIPHRLADRAMMCSDNLVDNLVMDVQQS
jgi:hypothetical protein